MLMRAVYPLPNPQRQWPIIALNCLTWVRRPSYSAPKTLINGFRCSPDVQACLVELELVIVEHCIIANEEKQGCSLIPLSSLSITKWCGWSLWSSAFSFYIHFFNTFDLKQLDIMDTIPDFLNCFLCVSKVFLTDVNENVFSDWRLWRMGFMEK